MKNIIDKATVIFYFIGTICGFIGLGYICWKCYTEQDIIKTGLYVLVEKWWIIVIELLLMIFNISLETLRWRELNKSRLSGESFLTSMKTINESILMSLGTIGGIGEHIGKARNNNNKLRTGIVSVYGSIIQTTIILVMALLGVNILGTDKFGIANFTRLLVIVLAVLLIVIALILYKFNSFKKIKYFIINYRKEHYNQNFKRLINVVFINILKYGVFSYQMYLMLTLSITSIDINIIAMIFVYYGVITIIPSASFGEIGIRGSMAAMCFGTIMMDGEIWASVAAMMVWIINRMLPGLMGFYSIIFSVIKSNKNHEESAIE